MPEDYMIKGGSYGECMYLILNGEALLFGMDSSLIGILRAGTFFHNGCVPHTENYNHKRIVHVIAKSLMIVGVISKDNVDMLF